MRKVLIFFLFFIFLNPLNLIAKPSVIKIVDFRVHALYRATKLTWKIKGDLKNPVPLQIMRADTFAEGPYKEVEVITLIPGKNSYEYIDKSLGTEATYHYKLVLKETGESFGPLSTRPYFSPPAT
ncbi:MAG: hypothetical protein ACPL5I_05440 [Thermodesulfobacteriota bacterium]